MDPQRFDDLIRTLISSSRRRLLVGLPGTLLVGATVWPGGETEARKKRRKRKKPRRNRFGCVPVGKPCRGKDRKCCSGICRGKRPKKGQRDKSRCVGHDEGGCRPGEQAAHCGGPFVASCTTSLGMSGICNTTTGNAGFCSTPTTFCVPPCATDADCQAGSGNPRAACVRCSVCPAGTGCAVPGPPFPPLAP